MNKVFLRSADFMRIPRNSLRGRSKICRQSHARVTVLKLDEPKLGVLRSFVLKPGGLKMKSKTRQGGLGDRGKSRNEQVRREIQSFLHALKSYPGRFARDPRVTFAEHHGGLVRAASPVSRRRI